MDREDDYVRAKVAAAHDQEEEKEVWKQPSPIVDGWPEEAKVARENTALLQKLMQERSEAIRQG